MLNPAPQSGSVLGGKYRIGRLLGEGGMGAVFEAENMLTHKRVAVKWMHPQLARNPQAAQRFLREAQALGRVRHPNVVDVYDVVQQNETLGLVMEYLEGESLRAYLSRGGASIPELVGLLVPAMRGVAMAHRQGIVHRDIKPDNIFLCREVDATGPVPKVLDFGISKLTGAGDLGLTGTGAALGTPMYMSIEQLNGVKDIDRRADVYAFGVILYEAVTGQPPYQADTFPMLAAKILTEQPADAKTLRPEVPLALSRLIGRAMAKDRQDRIPSLDELVRELEPFASEQGFRGQMTRSGATLPSVRPSGEQPDHSRDTARSGPPSAPAITGQRKVRRFPARSMLLLALFGVLMGVGWLLRGSEAEPKTGTTQTALPNTESVPVRPVAQAPAPAAVDAPAAVPSASAMAEPPTQLEPAPAVPTPVAVTQESATDSKKARRARRASASAARVAPDPAAPDLAAPVLQPAAAEPTPATQEPESTPAPSERKYRAGKPGRSDF